MYKVNFWKTPLRTSMHGWFGRWQPRRTHNDVRHFSNHMQQDIGIIDVAPERRRRE